MKPTVDIDGWLRGLGCQVCPSPFFDDRETSQAPDLVVIHNISLPAGQFMNGCVNALFMGTIDLNYHPSFASLKGLRVSSHFFIDRTGALFQFVSTQKRAWHAGVSSFQGRVRCNEFSIGIEMEGSDFVRFEAKQYQKLAQLLSVLTERYPSLNFMTGHKDIAPERKTDPGPFFNWLQLLNEPEYPKTLQYCPRTLF